MNPFQSGELVALLAEFKLSINDYLKELTSQVKSLSDIIAFNLNNPDQVCYPQKQHPLDKFSDTSYNICANVYTLWILVIAGEH